MAVGAKRQRVDRVGSEAAGDGDECKGRDGEGCPFSTADHKQRRQSLPVRWEVSGSSAEFHRHRAVWRSRLVPEAQPREVWVMIRLKPSHPSGSASTSSSSRKR